MIRIRGVEGGDFMGDSTLSVVEVGVEISILLSTSDRNWSSFFFFVGRKNADACERIGGHVIMACVVTASALLMTGFVINIVSFFRLYQRRVFCALYFNNDSYDLHYPMTRSALGAAMIV